MLSIVFGAMAQYDLLLLLLSFLYNLLISGNYNADNIKMCGATQSAKAFKAKLNLMKMYLIMSEWSNLKFVN